LEASWAQTVALISSQWGSVCCITRLVSTREEYVQYLGYVYCHQVRKSFCCLWIWRW